MTKKLRLVVGSDDAGLDYKEKIKADLQSSDRVESVVDVGVGDEENTAYPSIAIAAAELIAKGEADRALLVCGTGLGMAIAANKVPGVRAATAHDPYSAERARKSNNAQVLTMGARVIAPEAAEKVLDHWLTAEFQPGPSSPKVAKLEALDAKYHSTERSRQA